MPGLIVFVSLWLSAFFLLKAFFGKRISLKEKELSAAKDECRRLEFKEVKLKSENNALNRNFEATVNLYDMSKDIRRVLLKEEMLKIFLEHAGPYLKGGNCAFFENADDLEVRPDQTVLPLVIDRSEEGYLVIDGLNDENREAVMILARQLLSGIKGALLFKKVQGLTVVDSLTQVFNRRYFLERFQEEFERARRFKQSLSFLMIDVDHFKDYNDRLGHLVGDAVLKEVAARIRQSIRQVDFMGRYGGEEISVVLSEADKPKAREAAERVRQAIASSPIKVYDEELKVTSSIGLASFPLDAQIPQQLIECADKALYRAKEEGRNRVCQI